MRKLILTCCVFNRRRQTSAAATQRRVSPVIRGGVPQTNQRPTEGEYSEKTKRTVPLFQRVGASVPPHALAPKKRGRVPRRSAVFLASEGADSLLIEISALRAEID